MLDEQGRRVQFLLRDRDTKFCRAFDDLSRSEDAEVVLTPVQEPSANAFAERWFGTVRAEGAVASAVSEPPSGRLSP